MDSTEKVAGLRAGRYGHEKSAFSRPAREKANGSKTDGDLVSRLTSWPVLPEEALHGLPGEVVQSAAPHTEADPAALLTNMLVSFGNAIDQGAYFKVGSTLHHPKLFVALVGETSKARKGSSWDLVKELFHEVDLEWTDNRVVNGLSSGEGVIHAVRDQVYGKNKKGEEVLLLISA